MAYEQHANRVWPPLNMRRVTRRELLGSVGLTAGASLLAGSGATLHGATGPEETRSATCNPQKSEDDAGSQWRYVRLDPAAVADEAYRQVSNGGCMYGLFAGVMNVMVAEQREPRLSFPIHMMRYGEGGVAGWGSLCGAVNGGAAIIGLFEQDKQQRGSLIAQLLSWYETTELPSYQPKAAQDSPAVPKTVAGSILCHISVGSWCNTSGNEIGSQEMKERCRRLTAEVAAKTVELLNANLREPCKFAGLSSEVQSCLSCHNDELRDTLGKMRCNTCHQQLSTKHPTVPTSNSPERASQVDRQSTGLTAVHARNQ